MADIAKLLKNKKDTIKVLLTIDGEPLMNDVAKDGDEPTQMSITVNHPHSTAYQEIEFDLQDDMLEEVKGSEEGDIEMSARAIFERRLKKVVLNSVDWDITKGDVNKVGKPEFTQDAVKDLYKKVKPFMYQVEEALDKEAGFTKN